MHFLQTNGAWLLGSLLAVFLSITNALPTAPYTEACNATTRLVHQFPPGTWIENIAVRPNGMLLVTLLSVPELVLIDPLGFTTPVIVHTFPEALGLTGISEVTTDIFTITSTNFSLSTDDITPNSSIAWSVDLRGVSLSPSSNFTTLNPAPVVSKISTLPSIVFPNGQTALSSSDSTVLIGDIRTGSIFRLDTLTGMVSTVIFDSSTVAVSNPTFGTAGVNGIHVRDNILYFTNTGEGILAKIPIDEDGMPTGNPTVITRVLEGNQFDDFALRGDSAFFVTGSGNTIARVDLYGNGQQTVIAGSLNSTTLAEPTAAAFGRTEVDRDVLYVVTSGGLATPVFVDGKPVMVGGQVVAVDLSGCQW